MNAFRGLIPQLRPFAIQLLRVAGDAGLQPRITSTRRSHAEQARLYRRFLAGQNPFPVAPPGTSAHEFGMAFDMMIQDSPGRMAADLKELGKLWESWGGVWGGAFQDPIHFEFPGFPHSAAAAAKRGSIFSKVLKNREAIANVAASFIPGPLGIAASFVDKPLVADDVPWWEDPQGVAHGLYEVFKKPFT